MQGSGACWPGPQRLGAEMLERRRKPRLSWNCKAPPSETIQRLPGQRIKGYGSSLGPRRLAGSQCKSGGIQAPEACGPGFQGAWGPGGSLAKAWVSAETAASEVGTWRETKPGYPPYPPPPPFRGRKEEGFHLLRLRQPSNTPPKVGRLLALSEPKSPKP